MQRAEVETLNSEWWWENWPPPVWKTLEEERDDDSVCVFQLRAKSIQNQLEFLHFSLEKRVGTSWSSSLGAGAGEGTQTDGKPQERFAFLQEAQLVEHWCHPAQPPCEMSNATLGAEQGVVGRKEGTCAPFLAL